MLELSGLGAQILDTREGAEFEGAHLEGAVNVGLGGSYATWCGTVLDRERAVVVVADPGREQEAALRLGRIGFDVVAGYLDGGMHALDERPDLLAHVERVTAAALDEQLESPEPPVVVDVRTEREWRAQRIGGSVNIPLNRLGQQLDELSRDRPLVVYCVSGYRSAIAASILAGAGFASVVDLVGGLAGWAACCPDAVLADAG